jgi:hypothetical protein
MIDCEGSDPTVVHVVEFKSGVPHDVFSNLYN